MKNTPLEELRAAMIEHASRVLGTSVNIGLLGATVEKNGTVALATAEGEDVEDVASALATMFRSRALAGEITAAGLCWVSEYKSNDSQQSRAISTHCETVDGQSELCVTPYTGGIGQPPRLGNCEIRQQGRVEIFDSALMDELRCELQVPGLSVMTRNSEQCSPD